MAEKALKKVENQLKCSICLEIYTNPKLLQCFHIYCEKCLAKLVTVQQGECSISCPMCRQVTPLPSEEVSSLVPAFQIKHLLEIVEEHRRTVTHSTAALEVPTSSSSTAAPHGTVKVCCREHTGKEVELYCQTCEEPICLKCAIKGGSHCSHSYVEIDKAFEKYKDEITDLLEPMEKQLATVEATLSQVVACCEEIPSQQAYIEAELQRAFQQLQETLNIRKDMLLSQLHQTAQRKLKDLAVQKDQVETNQVQLTSCLGFMRESLKTNSKAEALMMKSNVVKQVRELTTLLPPITLVPDMEAKMVFSASPDTLIADCQNYGQISTHDSPDPSTLENSAEVEKKVVIEESVEGDKVKEQAAVKPSQTPTNFIITKAAQVAEVGKMASIFLRAVDSEGKLCHDQSEALECEVVSEITGARASGSLMKKYEVSYQPAVKGRHQLHLRVEGQHIRGSPFSVAAKSPISELGIPVLTVCGVTRPWGVVVNQKGEVIVAEYGAHVVSVFSPSGKKRGSFGSQGSGQGQFDYPSAVAVDNEGDIFVADWGNHCIQKLTATGQFITAVGSKGSGHLQFCNPKGIAFNSVNQKLYVTDNNHHIQILNSDLTFSAIFAIGKQGDGKGQSNYPYGIACDSAGEIYVTDIKNHCIQVFTAEGEFLRVFGRHGGDKGQLVNPIGIAVDSGGMVYVSEEGNHRISVFTSDGDFVTLFGSHGAGPGQFKFPCGICVDDSGVVYVCDSQNHRIILL